MNTPTWLVVLGAVLTLLGAGGGLASLALVRRQGRKLSADAAEVLSKTAIALVHPLEERLVAAEDRADAAEARAHAAEQMARVVRLELDGVHDEAHRLRRLLQRLRQLVVDPGAAADPAATVAGLRELFDRELFTYQRGENNGHNL